MNPALPPNLINPAFEELDEVGATEDVNFATEDSFLFKCWQSYDVQSTRAGDSIVPRSRNLFWRIWSNPNLRPVSNQEFNRLWQRCRDPIETTPLRPNQHLQRMIAKCPKEAGDVQTRKSSSPAFEPLPTPESPRPDKVTFDEESMARSGRDRTSSGSTGAASRPAYRRTGSNRVMSSAANKGRPSRPPLPRRRSSQNKPARTSADTVAPLTTIDPTTDNPPAKPAKFEFGSWEDEDDEEDKATPLEPPTPDASDPLVGNDFRARFAEARQLSVGTSIPPASILHRTRSSVRFADDTGEFPASFKGKGKERADIPRSTPRDRSDSQALADSDESEDRPALTRVQSSLSMQIKSKRAQSGDLNLEPIPPESAKIVEDKQKTEELLRKGREAARPIIPKSRRSSRDRPSANFELPEPGATF